VMNHTSRLIYSIAAALRGTAYHMVVMPYFPDEDPMSPIRYIVETESADGVILNQTTPDDPRIRYMAERGFPFATHGRTAMGIDHPFYDFDNEAFGRIGVTTLMERGRNRLYLVAPPRGHSYARHIITGFMDEAARQGATFEVEDSVTSDSGSDAIEEAVSRRFAKPNPPNGIVVASTTAAMATVCGIERSGAVLGRDVDIVAKEAIRFLRRFRPELIVVHEDVGKAGDFLARAVMAAIEKRAPEQGQFIDSPQKIEWGGTIAGR
jgi:LacI family transcriptional regulator